MATNRLNADEYNVNQVKSRLQALVLQINYTKFFIFEKGIFSGILNEVCSYKFYISV